MSGRRLDLPTAPDTHRLGETLGRMPKEYVARCEAQQLYYQMACVGEGDVEAV